MMMVPREELTRRGFMSVAGPSAALAYYARSADGDRLRIDPRSGEWWLSRGSRDILRGEADTLLAWLTATWPEVM